MEALSAAAGRSGSGGSFVEAELGVEEVTTATATTATTKIRISKIGGRYLVFDLADVARLRRQHNMCAFLVGITPQAPNQNIFNGLPLELAPDEVRWLVRDQHAAYVADDQAAHLASLASRAARRAYADSVLRQRQAAQAAVDEVAAQRKKRAAEARARQMSRSSRSSGGGGGGSPSPAMSGKDAKRAAKEAKRAAKQAAKAAADESTEADAAAAAAAAAAAGETAAETPAKKPHLLQITPTTSAGLVGAADKEEEEGEEAAAEEAETAETSALALALESGCDLSSPLSSPLTSPSSSPSSSVSSSSTSSSSTAASVYAFRTYLADRGFYTTPGLRFGGQLSVYPGDPFRYHAHFVATGYGWDEPIPLLDLVGTGRLAKGVKKGLLIGGARPPSTSDSSSKSSSGDGGQDEPTSSRVRAFTIEWAAI